LDLLVAAIVLLLLFAASYSGRGAGIALASTAVSAALLAGWFLLATAQDAAPFLSTLAERLPNVWSQRTEDLAKAIERASSSLTSSRKQTAQRAGEPVSAASLSQWFDGQGSNSRIFDSQMPDLQSTELERESGPGPQPQTETSPAPAKHDPPSASPHGPVKWILDEPPQGAGTMVVLTGANVSDEPLEDIRATLKPDPGTDASTHIAVPNAVKLRLHIEGQVIDDKGATSIPPGARFHLEAATLNANEAKRLGGAIVSFAYVQAGRRRTSIMYLTQTALAGRTAP